MSVIRPSAHRGPARLAHGHRAQLRPSPGHVRARAAEIGYGVRSDERGKGYASEALGAVARWALTEGGIQRAWLTANTENVASVRVAEKAGFRREGTLRRAGLEDDGLHDLAVFSLLDDEL